MKSIKFWMLAALPVLAGLVAFAVLFGNFGGPGDNAEAPPTLPAGVRELADYRVDGDVVHVNNTICAQMGAPLAPEAMGMFTTAVIYEGPLAEFRGKTLIFNQCCEHCVANFPEKWANERERVMRTHGLGVERAG